MSAVFGMDVEGWGSGKGRVGGSVRSCSQCWDGFSR
jgi:hypothetical protein